MFQSIKTGISNRLKNTQARFGLVFFILASSNMALGVVAMWPIIPEAPIWTKSIFALAMLGFAAAIALSVYWLLKGHEETTSKDMETIRRILEEERQQRKNIQSVLIALDWVLTRFKKDK